MQREAGASRFPHCTLVGGTQFRAVAADLRLFGTLKDEAALPSHLSRAVGALATIHLNYSKTQGNALRDWLKIVF